MSNFIKKKIDVYSNISFKRAAHIKTKIAITASSSVSRSILPTRAEWLIHTHSLSSLHMIYPEDAFDGYDPFFQQVRIIVMSSGEVQSTRAKKFWCNANRIWEAGRPQAGINALKKPPIQVPHSFCTKLGKPKFT